MYLYVCINIDMNIVYIYTYMRISIHIYIYIKVGDSAWSLTYKPPSHGGKSEVKNFFDKSHLSVSGI
jgi:hypothetical protein